MHIEPGQRNRWMRLFSASPAVIYFPWIHTEVSTLELMLQSDFPAAHVVMHPWFSLEHITGVGDSALVDFRRLVETYRTRHIDRRVVFLANTAEEYIILKQIGFESEFIHQNCLVNEDIYFPRHSDRQYDAIYNGQMHPFKRHYLAACIRRLVLIYGLFSEENEKYYSETKNVLPHADYLNGPPGSYRRLMQPEVAEAYSTARVGLCLSAVEGAMYASTEYLLAGIPVVSTHSKGGRDRLFDPAHSRIVEDDPASIAEAVRELAELRIDPLEIRGSVFTKMQTHRARLARTMSELTARPFDQSAIAIELAIRSGWQTLTYTSLNALAAEIR